MKNKLAGLCYFSSLSIVIIDGEAVAVRIFIEFNAYLLEKTFPYWIMRFLPD